MPNLTSARKALADHMEHEHLLPEEIGKLAALSGVKKVILYHLSPGVDNETSLAVYTAGVEKFYHGPVILSYDLEKIDVHP